jgi:hypothetical protein
VIVVVVTAVSHPVMHVGHDEGAVTTRVGVTGHALSEGGTLTVDVEILIHKICGGHVSSDGHFSSYSISQCQTKRRCCMRLTRLSVGPCLCISITRWTCRGFGN